MKDFIYGSLLQEGNPNDKELKILAEHTKASFVVFYEKPTGFVDRLMLNDFDFLFKDSKRWVFVGGKGKNMVPPKLNCFAGVLSVIRDGSDFLFVKETRSIKRNGKFINKNIIKCVSESLEVGETIESAASRGIKEELGATANNFKRIKVIENMTQDWKIADFCFIVITDEIKKNTEFKLQESEGIKEFIWINKETMSKYSLSEKSKWIIENCS